jgi:undecaprenyl diphosphate synthase
MMATGRRLTVVGMAELSSRVSSRVPHHIAIIMDGNGRWAAKRGQPRLFGHRAGTNNLRRVLEAATKTGVKVVTIYAFSTENWERSKDEVSGLMTLLGEALAREAPKLHKNGIQIRHLGTLQGVPEHLARRIREALELTRHNDRLVLQVAFNYGGRAEIVEAVRRIVRQGVPPEQIDEELISRHLYTAGVPDPDLIIRTAGEMRLSNFLLWQASYAEYYSTPTFWPDFDEVELQRALDAYTARERRYGGVPGSNGGTHEANHGTNGTGHHPQPNHTAEPSQPGQSAKASAHGAARPNILSPVVR